VRIVLLPHPVVSMHSPSCPVVLQTVFHLMALFTFVRDIFPQNSPFFSKFPVCCDSDYMFASFNSGLGKDDLMFYIRVVQKIRPFLIFTINIVKQELN
jgi:hypothetical protein